MSQSPMSQSPMSQSPMSQSPMSQSPMSQPPMSQSPMSRRIRGSGAPRVVAVGGGHGTATTLRAARQYASHVTAVVSVADDGGSSGRLRQLLDVVALGDMRKCLVALAHPTSFLAQAFEHRFEDGELAGHALGNLVLLGLVEAAGDLVTAIDEAAFLLGAVGRVLPASTEPVVLKAEADDGEINGQVAVASAGRIRRVSVVPVDASPPPEALEALHLADQVVIGPGSLYTSVLAAAAIRGIAEAIRTTAAQRVYVCNLHPQEPETAGYDVAAHLAALAEHGVEIDAVLWDSSTGMALDATANAGVDMVDVPLAGSNRFVHDPCKLAEALSGLLA
jgi:uncharacterized cofD-like protein